MATASERRKNKHVRSLRAARRFITISLKIGETFNSKEIKKKVYRDGIDVRGAVMDLVEEKVIERLGTINFRGGGTSVLYRRII